MRLLHVEDNPIDADLVARALKKAGNTQIELATGLSEARELLSNPGRFDAALIDLRLQDGSGFELLNEIRERALPLTVVMLTGSGDQAAAIASLQSGADDYVPKTVEAYAHLPATLVGARKRFSERTGVQSNALHVLYAEHNDADVDLTRRYLSRHAPFIKLTVVPDAILALSHIPPNAAAECEYDVLLLDYRLPGIDALDVVRTIRNERALDIPIVVVSGQGSEAVAAQAIQLGVYDYISKHPGYLYELAPTLEKVHRQHELLREQAVLKQTSQHLSHMLDASPVVLYTLEINGDDIRPVWVSSNIERLFGYSEQEALRENWWQQHLHPEDAATANDWFSRLLADDMLDYDYRFIDRQGRTRWVRDELRLLPEDQTGIRKAVGAWHDITEQRRAAMTQQTRIAALDQLISGQPLEPILHQLTRKLEDSLPDQRVSLLLLDENDNRLYTVAAPSLPKKFNDAVDGTPAKVGLGSCGTAAALGEPVIVEDVHTHPDWARFVHMTENAGVGACWSIPFKDESGKVLGTLAVYLDETGSPTAHDLDLVGEFARICGLAVQRSKAETNLRQAAAVFDSTREGVVITDLAPRIIAVNRAYSDITGYRQRDVIGCNPAILQSGRQDEAFYQAMWASILEQGHWQGEIWNRRKNGEVYAQLLTISTVRDSDGEAKNYVGVMTDISQLKQSEASLERLAHYDPLTGLPNRLLIHSRLEHSLTQARREDARVAVLFLDLDRFKNVNDSLGHPVGDDLLQALTKRLKQRLRGDDTFGRLGGDEFLIILDHTQRPDDAAGIARELITLLDEPFKLNGSNAIYIGASIGISIFPDDGEEATQLIQHADAAMYQAKEQGRNTFRFYTPALTAAVNQRMALESRMRRAISQGEFLLHYQPQVDLQSGCIVGCEALLRWDDPDIGLVSPADFIPLAEDTGLMIPLGAQVLQMACSQFRAWIDLGLPEFCLSINLSGRQLMRRDIVNEIRNVITQYSLPPQRMKFELTESMIMGRGEEAEALLGAIKKLGVKLSIDDFGTGYSSLAYLKRFPIDELKIDRSFVDEIPTNTSDTEIAATIIAMAHNLRLQVVAEGVETREQAAFLAEHRCSVYQGYLFSPPVPADQFTTLMRASVSPLAP